MDAVLQLLQQILAMFLLAGIGYFLFRTGKISIEGSRTFGNVLVSIVLPAVIVNSFLMEKTPEMVRGLLFSAGLAAAALAICIVLSRLIFRKDGIASFAASFSNPGFFGVPLMIVLLGDNSVPYVAAYIAFLNFLQYSYGGSLLTDGERKVSLKSVLTAPYLIAIAIGLILFFTQIKLPEVVSRSIGYIAGLNTPLAMFAVGVYLAQTDVRNMLKKGILYKIAFVRLFLIPLAVLLLLKMVPEQWHACKTAILIASACPTGVNVAVYAQLYDRDYRYAVETVIMSTLFSVLTIPAIVYLAELIW